MKIAILSDIHGNLPALQAVLADAKKHSLDHYFILGDLIGFYYDSRRVIEILNDMPATIIMGNHELLFLQCLENKVVRKNYKKKYGSSIEIALSELDNDHIDWIQNLPEKEIIKVNEKLFQLSHGSPWSIHQYVYSDSEPNIFKRLSKSEADIILLGHTHYPLLKNLENDKILVNPGSVGQARDKGGFASWCIYDEDSLNFQFQRTPYDTGPLLEQCKIIDPTVNYLQRVLSR